MILDGNLQTEIQPAKAAFFRSQRLAVFDDKILFHQRGEYWSDDAHILFLLALAPSFKELIICGRVAPAAREAPYLVKGSNVRVCPLPWYESVGSLYPRFPAFLPKVRAALNRELQEWDFFWLAWPHPISLWLLASQRGKPFLVVRQNLSRQIAVRYSGWQKFFGILATKLLHSLLKSRRKHTPIFTVGKEMAEYYRRSFPSVCPIEMSLVTGDALGKPRPPSAAPELKLLYVGRLDKEKDLLTLLRSVRFVIDKGVPHLRLDLVGLGTEEDILRREVALLNLSNHVFFHGYVAHGPRLFSFYQTADCFVLPSLTEGFPQVLNEAIALGLPVIATAVGGIPDIIHDKVNGLLVPAGNPAEMADRILELKNDRQLYAAIHARSLEQAALHTMEVQHARMLDFLYNHRAA